jgi:lysophospholipase L1-like esterase
MSNDIEMTNEMLNIIKNPINEYLINYTNRYENKIKELAEENEILTNKLNTILDEKKILIEKVKIIESRLLLVNAWKDRIRKEMDNMSTRLITLLNQKYIQINNNCIKVIDLLKSENEKSGNEKSENEKSENNNKK